MSVLESTASVQERLLHVLKAGQDAAVLVLTTLVASTGPITGLPAAPRFIGGSRVGTGVVDNVFGFAEKLLANQRQFATELAASASLRLNDASGDSWGTPPGAAQVEWRAGGDRRGLLQFSGLDLELDRVLDSSVARPRFFAGHSSIGQRYLVVQTRSDGRSGTWICAPITERALDFVVAGQAEVRDALTHTPTGAVDIVTVDSKGNRTESAKLCRDLDEGDLPAAGERVPF